MKKKRAIESGNKPISGSHLFGVLSHGQRNALRVTMNVWKHDLFPRFYDFFMLFLWVLCILLHRQNAWPCCFVYMITFLLLFYLRHTNKKSLYYLKRNETKKNKYKPKKKESWNVQRTNQRTKFYKRIAILM